MKFVLSKTVNPPIVFLTKLSEIRDRFDPEMVLFQRKVHQFKHPIRKLRSFYSEPAQYGAGERGIERESRDEPRYVRITDIDEYGILSSDLGATAANLEPRYLLEENDLLLARSGNTVGKSYLHKSEHAPYPCYFAGYLIRFRFKRDEILPEYVFALTQLPYYKRWVKAMQRAAGQPNINATEYSNFDVPAAPLPVQRKIILLLNEAYASKRRRDAEALTLLRGVNDLLLDELGIKQKPELPNTIESRIFFSSLVKMTGHRLDPNYSRKIDRFFSELESSTYPIRKMKEFLSIVQYGISELATAEEVGVPMLRMLNMQDGEWALSNLKYIAMSEAEKWPYLLNKDDILFNRTNSKELVGKCNVFDLEGEYVFASYLMRIRLKKDAELRPDFVVAYMSSTLGRLQIDAVSRQIAGMTNINAEELRELLIPVPPYHIQDAFCKRVTVIREQAIKLRRDAKQDLEQTKREMETLIFGKDAGK